MLLTAATFGTRTKAKFGEPLDGELLEENVHFWSLDKVLDCVMVCLLMQQVQHLRQRESGADFNLNPEENVSNPRFRTP